MTIGTKSFGWIGDARVKATSSPPPAACDGKYKRGEFLSTADIQIRNTVYSSPSNADEGMSQNKRERRPSWEIAQQFPFFFSWRIIVICKE